MVPSRSVFAVGKLLSVGLLAAAFTVGSQSVRAQGPAEKSEPSQGLIVYKPIPADFGPAYANDPTNGQKQTWKVYWGWVTSYYQGNLLSNGWIKETEISLARMTDPARRVELLKEMNEAGRLISREWAKDGDLRKITTSDLIAWGNRLNAIRRKEKGIDAELLTTARLIHDEAKQKIIGKTKSSAPTR